ncbi:MULTISPECIES: DUF3885 domain-containing protein [unclassified Peribacillus]|uniref:DUF3885 domain-containing protein n=1 Tax=unclassified Peribacillus TaxID=2675266 RepID=UPI0019142238|nr:MULTISPECIES: DUF3885 domain-containing protein [unclassified Peribacillus]MBK5445016.1 DUF3885 domain-containing protein [Peribacillus sp. TH24]MBK5460266.1 DUF3885 domain-containing protein [Peribacillus sp. TH27]WMX56446.1 DUF3885 domain-containing protein [Peribacillus sp. R9-11]
MRLLDQLKKNSNYSIRFELGLIQLKGKEYFDEMHHRATTILNSIFDKNDDILIVVCISNPIDYKKIDSPNIKRFIKNKKLIYDLKCKTIAFEFDEEDTEMETKQYSLKVKKHDIRLGYLIQSIGFKEFGMKPRVNGSFYLLNLTKETLFHMYDDRGCDVYGLEKEKLLPLYYKFRKWILDYDRIRFDRMFEQGLFNIYESPEDMEKRLELNEKKVKETGINLYQVNTCYITHELEIPKVFAEECLSEMTQTGFEINFEQKLSDSIILRATKKAALALVDYQTELMSLYSRKYKGKYNGWSAIKAF